MKTRMALFGFSLWLVLAGPVNPALSTEVQLHIPPLFQERPDWCWAAVGEMLFKFYDVPALHPTDYQCGIAQSRNHCKENQNCLECNLPAADDAGIITARAWQFGVPDRIGDEIEPGAFKGVKLPLPMLFSHDMADPVGTWEAADEKADGLHVRGDERVLDMGCGRGAVLIAVARRLTSGRVVGIDLWSTRDQPGNASDVTRRNASLEDVLDRVDIETGDMRALPFADGSFDLVVSSLAIHNIRGNAGRARAVSEAWRVLKPGGRLAIADIRSTARYARTLDALGATTTRRRLGWRFWYGNPIAATSLVTAMKPLS